MRFARRAEGIKTARTVFKMAREDTRTTYHLYVAAALMEYYCSKVTHLQFPFIFFFIPFIWWSSDVMLEHQMCSPACCNNNNNNNNNGIYIAPYGRNFRCTGWSQIKEDTVEPSLVGDS